MLTLFDSGALHASYISLDLVDKHRAALKDFITPVELETRLADSKTTVRISEKLEVDLAFIGPDGTTYLGREVLLVMKSLSEEVIIGLPTILNQWLPLYIGMLQESRVFRRVSNTAASQRRHRTLIIHRCSSTGR